jgi:hypothetical protein
MILHFEADSVAIEVTVKDPAGQPINLSAAIVEAVARRKNGATIPVASQVLDAAAGTILLRLERNQFRAGEHRLQVRVEIGVDRQTVVDATLQVDASLRAPSVE